MPSTRPARVRRAGKKAQYLRNFARVADNKARNYLRNGGGKHPPKCRPTQGSTTRTEITLTKYQ